MTHPQPPPDSAGRAKFELALARTLEPHESLTFKRDKYGEYVAPYVRKCWALWQAAEQGETVRTVRVLGKDVPVSPGIDPLTHYRLEHDEIRKAGFYDASELLAAYRRLVAQPPTPQAEEE